LAELAEKYCNEKSWQHRPAASAVRRCGGKRVATNLQHKYSKRYNLFTTYFDNFLLFKEQIFVL
jgi:hypothetical protein